LIETGPVADPTGRDRKVKVRFYDDGSIRFDIGNDANYAITEAYLTGNPKDGTSLKLIRLSQ
jgi:hypothetical protein